MIFNQNTVKRIVLWWFYGHCPFFVHLGMGWNIISNLGIAK